MRKSPSEIGLTPQAVVQHTRMPPRAGHVPRALKRTLRKTDPRTID